MTTISFIMPTFNRAEYVGLSLEKVLDQMGDEDELIVMDDGSTDSTKEVVESVSNRIRYIHQANAGKALAVNNAIGLATREAVWICDDDDLLRPGAVARLRRVLEDDPDIDIAFGRYSRFVMRDGAAMDLGTGYWPDLSTGSIARHELEDSFLMHNASLVRRSAYQRVGLHNASMLRSEDYDMYVRFALNCRFEFVDMVVYDQRQHEGLRGTGEVRHAANKSFEVWQDFDRRLFRRVDEEVPISFYEGLFSSPDADVLRRAAYLQRSVVLARKHLWAEAWRDLNSAADLQPDRALDAGERQIVGRLFGGKYGLSNLDASDYDTLVDLRRTGRAGRDIVVHAIDGALWRLKSSDVEERENTRRLLRATLPFPALGRAALTRIMKGQPSSQSLVERAEPAIYLNEPVLDPAVKV